MKPKKFRFSSHLDTVLATQPLICTIFPLRILKMELFAATAKLQTLETGQVHKPYSSMSASRKKDSRKNKVYVVKRERSGVKKARLEFTRLSAGECSLVRIRLHTGRSHQIRVQFASRGYPLVGDHKYGSRDERTDPMLFSCCIRFPWRGEQRRFEAMPDFGENP